MNVLKYISDTTFNTVIGLPCAVVDTALCVGKSAVGIAGTALSILTLGASRQVNKVASETHQTAYILPHLYIPVLNVVNPRAYADCDSFGVVTANTAMPVFQVANRATRQSNFFIRHVVSRVGYALGAAVSVISRVADLALGLVAGTFALIPLLGRVDCVNNFAVQHLMAFGVVHDVCVGFRGIVNPEQFLPQQIRHVDSDGDIYI